MKTMNCPEECIAVILDIGENFVAGIESIEYVLSSLCHRTL